MQVETLNSFLELQIVKNISKAMTEQLIEVSIENTNTTLYIKEGTSLEQILKMTTIDSQAPVVAAFVNNHTKELSYRIFSPKSIRFILMGTSDGIRVYSRSLFFMLQKATGDIVPEGHLKMLHPVGKGYYARIEGEEWTLTSEIVDKIKERMQSLVEQDLPIVRTKMRMQDAIEMYKKKGALDKLPLMQTRPQFYVSVFNLAGLTNYFFGAMVPSTSYLKTFDLEYFEGGMVLLMPSKTNIEKVESMHFSPKLFEVFTQSQKWSDIVGVSDVGTLNQRVIQGEASELIKVGEALHEKNFAQVADKIHQKNGAKIVLIAGPSSSGKTTSAMRLAIQLKVLGLDTHLISMDNYFVDREQTPRDENGDFDFEALEAVDVEMFNRDLTQLINGETIVIPKFDFQQGKKLFDPKREMRLGANSLVIIEGIHALNPNLTAHIDDKYKYRIYASALTTLALDNMSSMHTTDNRLLRRIVRDHRFRGRTAYTTLNGWPSVRRGEDKHIFPYQENCDVMLNTSLFFEIPILASQAKRLLITVPSNTPEYAEAMRLLKLLEYFVELNTFHLPPNSILREFIGESSFDY